MKVWSVANQKGGVGKTTTVASLGGFSAASGVQTLLVDLDPHGSLTAYFGWDPETVENGVYTIFHDQLRDPADLGNLVRATETDGLHLLPASTALATLDRQLGTRDGMGLVLGNAIEALQVQFDRVIIDCPPMLGVLVVNALAVCDRLIIPVQTEFLALKGLERMLHTLSMIARARGLQVPHTIVPTLFDRRTRASVDTLRVMREQYAEHLWPGVIPVDTQFREASRAGRPLGEFLPQARGAQAYNALLDFLLDAEKEADQVVAV